MNENSSGLLNNLFWKFFERFSTQVISLIVSIILARILDPENYGMISTVMIFISLANVFVTDGLGSALIQKKHVDKLDYSSVLSCNIIFSIILYLILFFIAPYITSFYGKGYELITPVLRILGLRLILSSVNSIQQAYLSRMMLFKKVFFPTFIGMILSGTIGIFMAYTGYGIWALVTQNLSNALISTVILQVIIWKYPGIKFSFSRLRNLFGFGSKMLLTGLMMNGFEQIRAVIIGKVYSSVDLAFYDRGNQFPSVFVNNVNASVGAVLFPRLSQLQDSKDQIKAIIRKSVRFSSYIIFPMMFGLAAVSEPLILVLLTEKWLPCVPLLRLFCLYYLFMPIHSANMQVVKAMGRSDIYMRVEILKKIIELIVLLITMKISVQAMVIGMAICSLLFVFFNAYPNTRLLQYKIKELLLDMCPAFILSLIMAMVVFIIGLFTFNMFIKLAIQIIVGVLVYLIISAISRNPEYIVIKNFIFRKSSINTRG